MWFSVFDVMDPQEAANLMSRLRDAPKAERHSVMGAEIIKKLRQTGLPGPFETVEADDAEGRLTGEVHVRSHGKRNRDGWAI